MERLTTNKNVSEMGMFKLALNCCYIAKDGSGRYRDYEIDIDERDFVRKLTTTFVGEYLPLQDESFDEEMMDNLGIDPFADVRGLIAIFYRNMWAMAELREKLKRYEDYEEQGLLLRLPCKVGDKLYRITPYAKEPIITIHVLQINIKQFFNEKIIVRIDVMDKMGESCYFLDDIGKKVFLSRAEAEAKLAETGGTE